MFRYRPRPLLFSGILLLLASVPAWAELYEWTDNGGSLHFTDDLSSVPAPYRKKMKTRETAADNPSATPTAPQPVQKSTPKPASRKMAPGKQEGFCGQSGATWKNNFQTVREELHNLREALPGQERELKIAHKKSVTSIGYTTHNKRHKEYIELDEQFKKTKELIIKLEKQLSGLEYEATKCGVPSEFRQ